jgi:hypothetical protein
MEILDKKSDEELVKSLLAEAAKSNNELRCAQQDINKANNRLNFILVLINTILERQSNK